MLLIGESSTRATFESGTPLVDGVPGHVVLFPNILGVAMFDKETHVQGATMLVLFGKQEVSNFPEPQLMEDRIGVLAGDFEVAIVALIAPRILHRGAEELKHMEANDPAEEPA